MPYTGLAHMDRGEMALTPVQQRTMFNMLNGGGTTYNNQRSVNQTFYMNIGVQGGEGRTGGQDIGSGIINAIKSKGLGL